MSLRRFEGEINKKSQENDDQIDNATVVDRLIEDDDALATSQNLSYQAVPIYLSFDKSFEITPNQLTIYREQSLGHGFFSDVFKGKLARANSILDVAVKMSKSNDDPEMQQAQRNVLRDELLIMHGLQKSGGHANVLRFVGAITTLRNEFSVLTEYCDLGSMDRFLQEKSSNGLFENELIFAKEENGTESEWQTWKILQDPAWDNNFLLRRENGQITTSDLLWFALQIARAMHFLTKKNVFHRDVALRNVLLKSNFTLKVADFGLSRRLFEGDEEYQVWKNHVALPFRYMAPETLASLIFTIHTECWSFGVVVWELFTFAVHQPYFQEIGNVGNNDSLWRRLESFLKSGGRMSTPKAAPEKITNLVLELWNENPQQRPSFQTCKKLLRKELMQSCPRILENEQLIASPSEISLFQVDDNKNHRDQKIGRVGCIAISVIIVLSILSAATLIIITSSVSRSPNERIKKNVGLNARWSWSFKASNIFTAELNAPVYGPVGGLNLGSKPNCHSLKWQPFFQWHGNETIAFLLQYVEGPPNLRAQRSMLLVTADGREVMVGNDFHRNHDGFVYNMAHFDTLTFALNLNQISNLSDNDVLTLKIEVLVDSTETECKNLIKEECERLQTNTKLCLIDSCYVGSNTPTMFAKARQFCKDIPSAAISRLAWIESEELFNKLREVMKNRLPTGEQINRPYYIGAKYFPGNGESSSIKGWQWIDSDLERKRSFPENISILIEGTKQHKIKHDSAVIFKDQNMFSAVSPLEYYHYLCEYRDKE